MIHCTYILCMFETSNYFLKPLYNDINIYIKQCKNRYNTNIHNGIIMAILIEINTFQTYVYTLYKITCKSSLQDLSYCHHNSITIPYLWGL